MGTIDAPKRLETEMTELSPLSTPKPASMFRIGVLSVLAAAASASLLFLPVHEYLSWFLAGVHDIGSWGAVLLGAVYIPAALLFFPGSLLTLGAGFTFGVGRGPGAEPGPQTQCHGETHDP